MLAWLPTMIPDTTTIAETVGEKHCISSSVATHDDHTASYTSNTDQAGCIKPFGRISTDQQSIHPFELDPDRDTDHTLDREHSDKEPLSASSTSEENPEREQQKQQGLSQPSVIRKKTSLAAKIRNVFANKQGSSKSIETQEDIISLSSNEDDRVNNGGKSKSLSQGDQHRGSVSSTSSAETAPGHNEARRDSNQIVTPITSPDNSPLCSPTIKSVPTLAQDSMTQHQPSAESSSQSQLPAQDTERLTGRDSNTSSPTNEDSTISESQSIIRPIPTRTVKKRLSFASISSFFGGARNPQERRSKQQRSSSLPHVENPLVAVGRQIAGFQRRHSLNDLEAKGQPINQHVTPPWEKSRGPSHPNTPISIPSSSNHMTASGQPPTPTKKLSLNGVFNKQLKKKKGANTRAVPLAPAKPLKSALVHRPPASANARVHHVHSTRRRSASVRSQSSSQRRSQYRQPPNLHHHHHHHHHHQHHHQSPRQLSPQIDPFARLAEANQALASLSINGSEARKSSVSGNQGCENSSVLHIADDFCTSPRDYENPNGQSFSPTRLPTDKKNDGLPNSCAMSTPPTPRVLPVITKPSKDNSSGSIYSPLPNPLASLSRTSSCCSFSSSTEDVNGTRSTSSLADSEGSCNSSTCSVQFEVNLTAISNPYPRNLAVVNDQTTTGVSSNISDGTVTDVAPVFSSLLPASAARISVDRIAFESQMNHNISSPTGNSCSTYESSSTLSNSSTAPSSNSSPGINNNDIKFVQCCQQGCNNNSQFHQQQQVASISYQHLKHQQQLMALDQQPYGGEYYTEDHQSQHHQRDQEYFLENDSSYDQYYYEDSSMYPPRPPRQLHFAEEPIIHVTYTPDQYDRTSDAYITASRLTPSIAQKIKLELNQFKSQEMEVHQDSRMYTHFFI
ncbi:bud neck involved protein [Entomortierella beljakovae]|nr:bud neck involved protein [Entomortierella beljakovae]